MMDFGRRWRDKGKDKEKEKEKEKDKEAKQREKEQRKEEKEREKERKRAENGHGNNKSNKELHMGEVDWKGARDNLRRRSASYTNEQKKMSSPKMRATLGRNSVSLLDLHTPKTPIKSPSTKGGVGNVDARTAKQKQKEKAFLESIAQNNASTDKPSVFAIASESYKLRILELEDEVSIANKRVTSLTDRVHMLEAEIRAANDHHTRHNANLQEKLANVETDNAVLKNNLATITAEKEELEAHLTDAENGAESKTKLEENGEGVKEEKITSSASAKSTTLAPPVAKSSSQTSVDKNVEAVLRQRLQVLEGELSAKTNDLAVLKLQISTLEPQVKTLSHDLTKAQQDASENEEVVTNVVEILGEWQAATESNDAELRDYLADESEVSPEEEVRRCNKKVLLLRERVSGADQTIYRMAKTVGVNSIRLDLGPLKGEAPGKEHSDSSNSNATRPVRSNSLSERDAALSIKLAVTTSGTEPAVQKLVKGIFLNTVRSVNLGGLVLSTEIIQSLSKALRVSTTVLSVLFPNTFIGDAGATHLADAMRNNSSITNLNMEECGVGDAGINELAQALIANRKTALVSLNISHNKIGVLGSQSLATFMENNHTLTKLDLGYSHLGAESAQFIAQILKCSNSLSQLLVPGNDFGDDGAIKFAPTLASNTTLKTFNFQGNGVTKVGVKEIAQALSRCHVASLDLSRNPIGPDGTQSLAEALKKNTFLKELSLISCGIHYQGASHLAACLKHNTTLTTLHLWGNKFGTAGLAAFLSDNNLGGIKTLDLRGNELPASAGLELSALLSKKSSLSVLDLTGNSLGPKGCEHLSKALSSSQITALYLSANSLGNDGVQQISRYLGPAITTLSLSLNFLGDDAMDYLAPALRSPSHITHLDLSWNHIGAGGARELSKVLEQANCPITLLNLEGNSLGPEGTVHLAAALHTNTSLTHLTLAANNFRKDGAKAVADLLKRSPTITNLNIAKNGIKDDGALALSDALKVNSSLAHLNLSENRVENQGIHALSEALKLNSSLLSINLSHNPFDRSGVQSLAQAHVRNPKVHVVIHTL